MKSDIEKKIDEITAYEDLSNKEKIDRLLVLRSDSRAAQRAATESGMDASDTLQTDLQAIDRALAVFGHDHEADEDNAATL